MTGPSVDQPGIPEQPRLSRLFRMQYEEVQKAWVLLYPEGMVQLNDSSAEILKLCTGEMTVATIVSTLEAKFNAQGIGPQIRDLLQEGVRRGWIQ